MDWKRFIDHFDLITCVIAVEKTSDGAYGKIRIAAANQPYLDSMAVSASKGELIDPQDVQFVPNSEYTRYIPKDLNLEDVCYRCAVLKQPIHNCIRAPRFSFDMNIFLMPLAYEDDQYAYCTYSQIFLPRTENNLMSMNISLETAMDVLGTCIKLRGDGHFHDNMGEVIEDIRSICGADFCCVLLMDDKSNSCSVLGEAKAPESDLLWMEEYLDDQFYDLAKTILDTIGGSYCLVIRNQHDMEYIRERNPRWYQSLIQAGVETLVIFPLFSQGQFLGYLWAINFDTENTVRIKDTMELTAYFIASEISNKRFISQGKDKIDLLTGVMNRDAMADRLSALSEAKDDATGRMGIVFVDLNGMKAVNERQGQVAGDLLLKNAAMILQGTFTGDEIYRAGGDEFLILLSETDEPEMSRKISDIKAKSEMFENVSFSAGSCMADGDIRRAVSEAEALMYADKAKATGITAAKKRPSLRDDSMLKMDNIIAGLRDDMSQHASQLNAQANSMITAMASDYRSVYHVDLDKNDGVCYRGDPNDACQTPEGIHFPYLERFTWYANNIVTENYREGFLSFIDPKNIRESLAAKRVITYRYLAKRDVHEYYEMIRMSGVRLPGDRQDHIVHAVGVGLTDIDSEMRESMAKNEALAEALSVAEEASRAKTAFLSNMSHEIRTPMNAIIGLDKLALRDPALTGQTREYLEKIGESASHLLGLINDILDMSRIESGHLVLRRKEFSFRDMLEQINLMVMTQCGDKGLAYESRLLNRVSDCFIGDDMKLKEVLLNILSNAIKFTDAPGSVTMTVEQTAVYADQTTLRFRIRDTGIGIDKDYIPRIFDAFSQEDSSRKNKYGSTGLGMAITKAIVEMMNGSMHVESEKGVGTEFTVMVTLRNCEQETDDGAGELDVNSLRVLVVDDDPTAAEEARLILDERGVRADVAYSAREALQMIQVQHAKQDPYSLVLMDWKMPDIDGVDATRALRALYDRESTIIILTAYDRDEVMDDAMLAGADDVLSKPLSVPDVLRGFQRSARRNNLSLFREKQRAELAGRRILLAEDFDINAEILMDILSMEDIEADHAKNGRLAVEMFEQSPAGRYAAILMDVRMPEMDGLEAAEAIRALPRDDAKRIPIIALTANAFDEDVQRSMQAGMNSHLSKPVDSDRLFQTLGELIYEAEGS